jgi:hypothetical protein
VGKALTEASALRTVRHATGGEAACVVMLTASQAMTATTVALGGIAHIRLVHDVGVPEGRVLRAFERISQANLKRVTLVCTTDPVRRELLARDGRLDVVVQPFTVDDPTMYLSSDERDEARGALGIGSQEFAVCMVGGWWDYKDLDLVERGLAALSQAVTLLLVGNPMQPERLERPVASGGGRIVALQGAVTEAELRQVYAASDCALVTRVPGFDREASTIYDATRYGVPLVVTDHDPAMHERLAREPSIRLVPAGDADALSAALRDAALSPSPRPDRDVSARLGLVTGESKIRFYEELSAHLQNP